MSVPGTGQFSAERHGGLFPLLMLAIFSTEVVVEGICAPLFERLDAVSWGGVDALILTLLFVLPLWFFFVRPLHELADPPATGPRVLLLQSVSVIFAAEFLVMLILPLALPGLSPHLRDLLDALCTTALSVPFLYWLFSREERLSGRALAQELLQTPLRLYIVLLLMVFLLTLLQEFLAPHYLEFLPGRWNHLLESLFVTILFAPVLLFLVVRPLQRAALSERARVNAVCSEVIDAVMTVDSEGAIKSVNPAAERIFGYREPEIVGGYADVLFKDGRECLQSLLVRAAPAGKRAVSHELLATCCDGALLTMDTSVSRVKMSDCHEFLLIMRDVSERQRMQREIRESEERFRQIFEQSNDAIIFFHPETCAIIDLNDTTEALYGCSKEELKAGGVAALVRGEEVPALTAMIRGCSGGGSSHLDLAVYRRRDGRELFLSMRGKLMTVQGAELVYCTFRDITARIRLEEEAREMQARLIEMNKMASLGLVVSGVAHEVNNPNNFIYSSSQLLTRAWQDALEILRHYREENGDFLLGGLPFEQMAAHIPELNAGVEEGSRRINEIINNLKSFARQGRGGHQPVDLNQVVQRAVSMLQYELAKHTETFHLELASDLPLVQGNGQQLGQVAVSLLLNACQALPSREGGIWLSTSYEEERGEVLISVRDEGCGISSGERERVMEPFFTTKLDRGGTGLGLSISQSIVKEHRGVLEFDSEPGRGSTFVVRLPVVQSEQGNG